MEYLYYLANASLTLRIVEHLHGRPQMPLSFITVIHQIDGWVVKVKMKSPLNSQQDGDFRYQVAIVSHGNPEREEIETFRQQFVKGLGYCPETLA